MQKAFFLCVLSGLMATLCFGQTGLRIADKRFNSSDSIFSQGKMEVSGQTTVKRNTRVELVSGKEILLGPGFEVEQGAVFDAYLRRDSSGAIPAAIARDEEAGRGLMVFPNPARDIVHILSVKSILRVNVADENGRIIQTLIPAGGYAIELVLSGRPVGVYTLSILYANACVSRKVILTK